MKRNLLIFFIAAVILHPSGVFSFKSPGTCNIEKKGQELYPSGRVKNGFISGKVKLNGINLNPGTEINLYESGELKSLKDWKSDKPVVIQGIPVMSHYPHFYKNGRLKKAYLSKDFEINGVVYKSVFRKEYFDVSFYENGSIKRGGLAEDHSFLINGKEFLIKRGSAIVFDPKGNIYALFLPEVKKVFYKGKPVNLYESESCFAVYKNFNKREVSALGIMTDGSFLPGKSIRFDSYEITFFKYSKTKNPEYPFSFFEDNVPVSMMRTADCIVRIDGNKFEMKKFQWMDLR